MTASRGLRVSLGMHAVLLLLVVFGLPAFFKAQREEIPLVISMEILPISEMSNVKAASKTPAPTPEMPKEQPKEQPKPVEPPKEAPPAPATPTKTEAPSEPSPRELISPDAPKVEEKKKEPEKPKEDPKPKKDEPKKEKPKEDDLAAILKSVATAAKKEAPKTPPSKEATQQTAPAQEQSDKQAVSQNYDASMPLSMSESDAIKNQIMRCWSIPAGAKNAEDLVVVLRMRFNQDGSLSGLPELAENTARYNTDNFFRAAVDSAKRAARQCTPLQGMPANRYGSWKDVEVEFNPRNALFLEMRALLLIGVGIIIATTIAMALFTLRPKLSATERELRKTLEEPTCQYPRMSRPPALQQTHISYEPPIRYSPSRYADIMLQITRCWSIPAGAKNWPDLIVVLRVRFNPDGSLYAMPELAENTARYNTDNFFRAAVDSAKRAVLRCTPLQNMPLMHYAPDQQMLLTFDPSTMRY